MKKNKEMEVCSENEENFSPEKQKRINGEMKKRKKRNISNCFCKIYCIHNKKDQYIPWEITKTEEQRKRIIQKYLYY